MTPVEQRNDCASRSFEPDTGVYQMLLKFITGAAAIALAAASVHADPGGGKGGDKGNGGSKGGGGDHAGHVQSDPGNGKNGGGNGKDKRSDARDDAPRSNSDKQARGPDRFQDRGNPDRSDDGAKNRNQRADKFKSRGDDRDDVRITRDDSRADRFDDRGGRNGKRFSWSSLDRRDVVRGCPPGLAKKNNGCLPPGQAKARYDDWREGYDRPDWWGLNGYDGRYSYHDGSLLRLGSNGSILGYLPLLGGALAPGNLWPSFYESVAVPDYYQDYYNLGTDDSYRYYDDAFYSVDPETGTIGSIAALLTGDDFAVGQRLPQGYDVYNVPYSYRDKYADGPDANYRYSDGYVYEVDPKTKLIQTVIELLT